MSNKRAALVGVFAHDDQIMQAADGARQKGWKGLDAYVPYPLHGLDKALGLKRSWVPWVTLVMGLSGAAGGFALQVWTSAVDWPLIVGGKPFISWPAFLPITFESGVLIAGLSTFVAIWAACKLPKAKPVIHDERFTDDKFGLIVPLDHANEADVRAFLNAQGAEEVKRVEI
jgi:hypothetical protein